jgi:hypothetical protein
MLRKRLLAQTFIERDQRKRWLRILSLTRIRRALPERAQHHSSARSSTGSNVLNGVRSACRRAREIQKARHQRAQAVGLGRNVSRKFGGQRIRRACSFWRQHLRRPFDHAQRIANLVRQAQPTSWPKAASRSERRASACACSRRRFVSAKSFRQVPDSVCVWRRLSTTRNG